MATPLQCLLTRVSITHLQPQARLSMFPTLQLPQNWSSITNLRPLLHFHRTPNTRSTPNSTFPRREWPTSG